MSMVRLEDCIRNTKGLVPADCLFQLSLTGKDLSERRYTASEFTEVYPRLAKSYEWVVTPKGLRFDTGVVLNFENWVQEGGEPRLLDVIEATVRQWGTHAYKRTMEKAR